MRDDYEKLFAHVPRREPSGALAGMIMLRIRKEERFFAMRRAGIFFIGVIGSLAAFIPAFSAMQADMAQSGIVQFISLVFSDPALVAGIWNDFIFSVLEALPIMSVAAFLTAALMLLGSLRSFVRNIAVISPRHHFIH